MDGASSNHRCRPVVLRIELARLAPGRPEPVRAQAWRGSSEGIDRVGCLAGTALALALLHERETASPGAPAPLVLAVGGCVARALPTAARATVASRSPLTGLLAEGQVGSDLGRRLARIADAVLVEGATHVPGGVLVLSGEDPLDASVELRSFPELADADPRRIHAVLASALGPCASLRTGRAGARGIPFACLVAGSDPPSFVGRGGLGAVLGRLGLSAIAFRARPVDPDPADESSELVRLLARSPRLRARGQGGTFETAEALAAGGSLRGAGEQPVSPVEARAWSEGIAQLRSARSAKKGCEGCPTPCGWIFERGFPGGEVRSEGGRFGATFALGPRLGLDRPEDALALLSACDAAALDAIETGAVLELLARARGSRPGGREAELARIEDLLERRGDGGLLALGASAMARELGLEVEVRAARGQGARADARLASILGQCVGARGSDPMRTFPFLLADAPPARLRELLAPIPLPRGAEDPRDPVAKGRIVWWHENLMAAIDASGFCAFSAAGLLADGVADLDDLARSIAPHGSSPRTARSLLAAGASIVAVARDLARRYGASPEADRPPWARADLELPGMWEEYAALRGLDATGGPSADTWSRLGSESILDVGARSLALGDRPAEAPRPSPAEPLPRSPGQVRLRCSGPLARALGAPQPDRVVTVDLDLPARLAEVLAAAARDAPEAGPHLIRRGEAVPAAYRLSRRLLPEDLVRDGDELDLVVALSGGRTDWLLCGDARPTSSRGNDLRSVRSC